MNTVDELFKEAMAQVVTPVSIVTSMDSNSPSGSTVSAFLSLSMNPPMVLVSLNKGSQTLGAVTSSGRFGLNLLAVDQHETALTFAGKGGAGKFAEIEWELENGVPRIAGTAGWVACRVDQVVEGGDHMIVLGHVEVAEHTHREPLTYRCRTFGTHSALQLV